MVNTISFSPDMRTLYLIDSGRTIPFALDKGNGVLIAILHGQITVVSAPDSPFGKPDDVPDSPSGTSGDSPEDPNSPARRSLATDPTSSISLPMYPRRISIPVADSQWNVFNNQENQALVVIGTTDINAGIREERDLVPEIAVFKLRNRVLNIRFLNDRLYFTLSNLL